MFKVLALGLVIASACLPAVGETTMSADACRQLAVQTRAAATASKALIEVIRSALPADVAHLAEIGDTTFAEKLEQPSDPLPAVSRETAAYLASATRALAPLLRYEASAVVAAGALEKCAAD